LEPFGDVVLDHNSPVLFHARRRHGSSLVEVVCSSVYAGNPIGRILARSYTELKAGVKAGRRLPTSTAWYIYVRAPGDRK
jgi:hypothetical protein